MVFLDESGFLLQPLRRRVWAPRGQTPVQYAWDRHDRITTLAALTRAPGAQRFGLYYDLLHHNARTDDVVRFLRQVHNHLRRPLLLVCDRLPAHRSAIRRLHNAGCSWLEVSWLPSCGDLRLQLASADNGTLVIQTGGSFELVSKTASIGSMSMTTTAIPSVPAMPCGSSITSMPERETEN